jgi:hypothetical protein
MGVRMSEGILLRRDEAKFSGIILDFRVNVNIRVSRNS